jgi:hypothetical protein
MGFFTLYSLFALLALVICRNPFQGGMGFFTEKEGKMTELQGLGSQSLSGWDGVFHRITPRLL